MPASAMVDVSYPNSDEARRLRRLLENDFADVLPIRLWCWGVATGREDGRFEADAKQLAEIVNFFGDSQKLLDAFLDCNVIAKTKKENEYRIRGWRINAKYFKERNRLRKYNATRGKRVDNARKNSAPRVNHGSTSTSTSTSTDSKRENARATGINHPEVQFFESAYRERFPGPPLTATERSQAYEILRQLGEAQIRWQAVLEFYAKGFSFSGHTVTWLQRNLREVLNKMPAPPQDFAARIAEAEARNKAELEEFS